LRGAAVHGRQRRPGSGPSPGVAVGIEWIGSPDHFVAVVEPVAVGVLRSGVGAQFGLLAVGEPVTVGVGDRRIGVERAGGLLVVAEPVVVGVGVVGVAADRDLVLGRQPVTIGIELGGATGSVLFGALVDVDGTVGPGAELDVAAVVGEASGAGARRSPITAATTTAGSGPSFVNAAGPGTVADPPAATVSAPSPIATSPAVTSTKTGLSLPIDKDSPAASTSRTRFTSRPPAPGAMTVSPAGVAVAGASAADRVIDQ
jgi:hypothetical protein